MAREKQAKLVVDKALEQRIQEMAEKDGCSGVLSRVFNTYFNQKPSRPGFALGAVNDDLYFAEKYELIRKLFWRNVVIILVFSAIIMLGALFSVKHLSVSLIFIIIPGLITLFANSRAKRLENDYGQVNHFKPLEQVLIENKVSNLESLKSLLAETNSVYPSNRSKVNQYQILKMIVWTTAVVALITAVVPNSDLKFWIAISYIAFLAITCLAIIGMGLIKRNKRIRLIEFQKELQIIQREWQVLEDK